MHHNIFIIKTLENSKYKVEIYSINPDTNIDNFLVANPDILEANYPRQIGDSLLVVENVNMVKVFDNISKKIIFVSSNILPEEINE